VAPEIAVQSEARFEGAAPECTAGVTCALQPYHWYDSVGVGTPTQPVDVALKTPEVVAPPEIVASLAVEGVSAWVIDDEAVKELYEPVEFVAVTEAITTAWFESMSDVVVLPIALQPAVVIVPDD